MSFNMSPWLLLLAPVAMGLAACTGAGPLDDDQPRAPNTHYRELRGDDPPLTVETPLGETRPNLRDRLLDK
jgi:hypothetical protein